jgi:hypothetical protein
LRVEGTGFRVWGLEEALDEAGLPRGFGGLRFRVQGSRFRVQGSEFRVQGLRYDAIPYQTGGVLLCHSRMDFSEYFSIQVTRSRKPWNLDPND